MGEIFDDQITEKIDLVLPLTDQERMSYGKAIAEKVISAQIKKNELAIYNKKEKQVIEDLLNQAQEISQLLSNGESMRTVEARKEEDKDTIRWYYPIDSGTLVRKINKNDEELINEFTNDGKEIENVF